VCGSEPVKSRLSWRHLASLPGIRAACKIRQETRHGGRIDALFFQLEDRLRSGNHSVVVHFSDGNIERRVNRRRRAASGHKIPSAVFFPRFAPENRATGATNRAGARRCRFPNRARRGRMRSSCGRDLNFSGETSFQGMTRRFDSRDDCQFDGFRPRHRMPMSAAISIKGREMHFPPAPAQASKFHARLGAQKRRDELSNIPALPVRLLKALVRLTARRSQCQGVRHF